MPRYVLDGVLIGAVPRCRVPAYASLHYNDATLKDFFLGETTSAPGGYFKMNVDLWGTLRDPQNQIDMQQVDKIWLRIGDREDQTSQHYPSESKEVDRSEEGSEEPEIPVRFGHIEFLREPRNMTEEQRKRYDWKNIFATRERDSFMAGQNVHFELPNHDEFWTVSGVVGTRLQGSGPEWKIWHVVLEVPLPPAVIPFPPTAPPTCFQVKQWSSTITPVAFSNEKHAVNAGWAVGDHGGPWDVRIMPCYPEPTMVLQADVQVRDSDGFVEGLAYECTMVGKRAMVSYGD